MQRTSIPAKSRVIVALDVDNMDAVERLIGELPEVSLFKVGLQLLTKVGAPKVVEYVNKRDKYVFFDGKFDDIPNTVGEASKAVAEMHVNMFNVHASAGIPAMRAAVENSGNARVLAVTVLTSLGEDEAHLIYGAPSKAKVLQFARDALIAGCDGIVCSPQELEILDKQKELAKMLRVTPGVRPEWAALGDQKRVMTPGEAILAGADYLVIGRPITNPPNQWSPSYVSGLIVEEIKNALERRKEKVYA